MWHLFILVYLNLIYLLIKITCIISHKQITKVGNFVKFYKFLEYSWSHRSPNLLLWKLDFLVVTIFFRSSPPRFLNAFCLTTKHFTGCQIIQSLRNYIIFPDVLQKFSYWKFDTAENPQWNLMTLIIIEIKPYIQNRYQTIIRN